MGRPAKAGYRLRWKGQCAYVRFTFEGTFYDDIPTGARDERTAHAIAGRIYADVVEGRYRPQADGDINRAAAANALLALEDLTAEWYVEYDDLHPHSDTSSVTTYIKKWLAFFRRPRAEKATLGDVADDS